VNDDAFESALDLRRLWLLESDVVFLNHGSFGACPLSVLEAQSQFRRRLEADPVRFLARELEGLLDAARESLAAFVGADPAGVAFVRNATTAVNTVLRSLRIESGDELLTTNHAYPSCRNALDRVAKETGARVVEAEFPFPVESPEEVLEAVLSHANSRTKICVIDHVTSPTGLVLPVAELTKRLAAKGIDVLIDGAHAPGMLPLDIEETGAAYYTGNCHKWICAPKGSAFLYVREDRRHLVRPLVTSLGYESPRTDRSAYHLQFDWVGTDDPTPFLCVPAAIQFIGSLLPGGWAELMARNRRTALAGRAKICDALGVPAPCPDEMVGSLASVPLPEGEAGKPRGMQLRGARSAGDTGSALGADGRFTGSGRGATQPHTRNGRTDDPLQAALFEKYRIEVPVIAWPAQPRRLIRISAQVYNKPAEYDFLAGSLKELLGL